MFEELLAKHDAAEAAVREERARVAKLLKEEYAKIGKELPSRIKGFSWSQYTPYFNDGEPCRFSVHDIATLIAYDADGNEIEIYVYNPSEERMKQKSQNDPELFEHLMIAVPLVHKLDKFNRSHKDLLEQVFGDHVQITISKTGIYIDDCHHD